MKQLIICLSIFTFFAADAMAQRYGTALGIRGGRSDFGVTLQQRVMPRTTIEGLLTFNKNYTTFTALGEYHQPIIGKTLDYYIGGGFHRAMTAKEDFNSYSGLDVILGIEFKIPALPIQASADIKPAFNFGDVEQTTVWETGISFRYIIVKHKDIQKRKRQRERERRKKNGETFLDRFKKKEDPKGKKKNQSSGSKFGDIFKKN